jgi:hypothetical protein
MHISRYFVLLGLGCLLLVSAVAADSFCSKVETGSTMILTAGSISTEMGNRFISGSADAGTGIYNNVLVSEYAPGIPAQGSVSAFISGRVIQDGQVVEFNDVTSIIGTISTFSKSMSYGSMPSTACF